MKKKIVMILLLTAWAVVATGCGKIEGSPVSPLGVQEQDSPFKNKDNDIIQGFATEVQKNVGEQDWKALSEKIAYPITVGSKQFESAEEFAEYDIKSLLSDDFFEVVANTDCSQLVIDSEGIRFGDGEIQISEPIDSSGESMGIRVVAINVAE